MTNYNKYTIYYLSSLPSKDNLKAAWIAANAGGKKGGSAPDPGPGPSPAPGPSPTPSGDIPSSWTDWVSDNFYDVIIDMPESKEIDFLYTSDIHVSWKDFGGSRFGSKAKYFSLDHDQLAENKESPGGDITAYQTLLMKHGIPTFLLDCGDWSKNADYGKGPKGIDYTKYAETCIDHAVDMMQKMKYLGVAIGNWEYKWGELNYMSRPLKYINRMKDYGLTVCNLNDKDNVPLYPGGVNKDFPGCKLIKVGDKKIALIGVSYPSPNGLETFGTNYVSYSSNSYSWTYTDSSKKYKWHDSLNSAKKQKAGTVDHTKSGSLYGRIQGYVDKLRNDYKFDYIIVFGHMDEYRKENYNQDDRFYSRAEFLLLNTTGIDVFIPGHLNFDDPETTPVKWKNSDHYGIIAPEAGAQLMSFGRMKIDLSNDTITCKLLNDVSHLSKVNINEIQYIEKNNRWND